MDAFADEHMHVFQELSYSFTNNAVRSLAVDGWWDEWRMVDGCLISVSLGKTAHVVAWMYECMLVRN